MNSRFNTPENQGSSTPHELAEQALKESEERLRLSQEAAHIGNFDWNLQTGDKVWSAELEALYGLPPGGFPQDKAAWESLVHPEDREEALAAVERALESGDLIEHEWRVVWPDGSEHWLAGRFQAYHDKSGKPVRLVGVNLDITCRRRNEEALRASEASTKAILDSALDAVIKMDHQGILVGFNPAAERIFGFSSEEVLGRSMAEVIIPERFREAHRRGLARYLENGEGPVLNRQSELPALRADGTEFPAEMSIIAIPGSVPPVFTGFLRDVTERKRMENSLRERAEALARADRNKDEFLAMLAHELRNPLGPLRNAAEILSAEHTSASENTQARRIIVRQIENMSRMLDDLLDVSRLTEGRIELRKKPTSLGAILTAATSLLRSGCAAQRQEVTLTLPAVPIHLEADATRLEQIFGNLLGNACKYAGEDRHIEVIAEREEGIDPSEAFARITVRDDGAGIAPDLLPHVFDLFVQASRTLDRQHGGLGIGLTLVRRLVELHGGTVEARSEGLGKGAEFIIRLPILAGPPATAHHDPPSVKSETPRRILIVDDNIDSANSLAVLQSYRGHETRTAFTGPDAVNDAAEFLPEVVLLDIGLPGMDGFEVARQIRAIPALQNTLVIAMSGYGRKEVLEEAALAGFDHYLVKPIDLEILRQRMEDHSRSASAE